jgi:carbonic anhydrase
MKVLQKVPLILCLLSIASSEASSVQSDYYYTYDPNDEHGPSLWKYLDIADNECGGDAQSGIDIPSSTTCDDTQEYGIDAGSCSIGDLSFFLDPDAVKVKYNNTENPPCEPPRMKIPGEANPWQVVQFHIHLGSEHAIDGHYFAADLHVVHKVCRVLTHRILLCSALTKCLTLCSTVFETKQEVGGDRYAVLGLFIEPTSRSNVDTFEDLLHEWKAVEASVSQTCGSDTSNGTMVESDENKERLKKYFNPYDLIPKGASIYTYDGSETIPPCSEIVYWNVLDTPVKVSNSEYRALMDLILGYVDPQTCENATTAAPSGVTSRPVQLINGRTITRHCPANLQGSNDQGASLGDSGVSTPFSIFASLASLLALVMMI